MIPQDDRGFGVVRLSVVEARSLSLIALITRQYKEIRMIVDLHDFQAICSAIYDFLVASC